MAKKRTIILVQAPDIPAIEVKMLEKHWKEALDDPEYMVITNYEVRVDVIDVQPDHMLMVTAPGLPPSEIANLRKKIDKAKARRKGLVVINYEARIDQVPVG